MSGGTGAVRGYSTMRDPEPDSTAGTAFHGWLHASALEFSGLPSAVPCGRLHIRQVVWEWQPGYLAEDAEMLASELLGNAVKASWSPDGPGLIALRLLANEHRLLIEVWDHHPGDPTLSPADDESESGRGLMVVEAIAHRWGYQRVSANLKVVWCELVIRRG